jgi:hypothetical protein
MLYYFKMCYYYIVFKYLFTYAKKDSNLCDSNRWRWYWGMIIELNVERIQAFFGDYILVIIFGGFASSIMM